MHCDNLLFFHCLSKKKPCRAHVILFYIFEAKKILCLRLNVCKQTTLLACVDVALPNGAA